MASCHLSIAMTTVGQRLRRRSGNVLSSTEWSGLSSAVAKSQRKWRKSAGCFSCRCARWAPQQGPRHMTPEDCPVTSAVGLFSVSVPAEGEWDQREEKCGFPAEPHQVFSCPVQVRVTTTWAWGNYTHLRAFLIRKGPSNVLKVWSETFNDDSGDITTVMLTPLGPHLEYQRRKTWNKIVKNKVNQCISKNVRSYKAHVCVVLLHLFFVILTIFKDLCLLTCYGQWIGCHF